MRRNDRQSPCFLCRAGSARALRANNARAQLILCHCLLTGPPPYQAYSNYILHECCNLRYIGPVLRTWKIITPSRCPRCLTRFAFGGPRSPHWDLDHPAWCSSALSILSHLEENGCFVR